MQDLLFATKYLMRDLLDDPENWVLYGLSVADTKAAAALRRKERQKIWRDFWMFCEKTFREIVNGFSVHQAVELGDKARKEGKRVVFGIFETGCDMRHEVWSMFGKKNPLKTGSGEELVCKSLLGMDEVGDPANRVGRAGSVAGVGDEEDDLLADGAAAGNNAAANKGAKKDNGSAPKMKIAAMKVVKQQAGKKSAAIGDDTDVTRTALMRVAKKFEAVPQNSTTARRKKHYAGQIQELRTLKTGPDGQPQRKWREGGNVGPHEIVPGLVLQQLLDKLIGYRVGQHQQKKVVSGTEKKPFCFLQAATEKGRKRIEDLVNIYKALPMSECCPALVDYLIDYYGTATVGFLFAPPQGQVVPAPPGPGSVLVRRGVVVLEFFVISDEICWLGVVSMISAAEL